MVGPIQRCVCTSPDSWPVEISKNVLLITRSYYPLNVASAHRPVKLAKFLPGFGWTPHVLTLDWTRRYAQRVYGFDCYDPLLVGQSPCETTCLPIRSYPKYSIKGILDRSYGKFSRYRVSWRLYRDLLNAARDLVRQKSFDAILAESPSSWVLAIADQIARESRIAWVADLQDIPDELGGQITRAQWRQIRLEVATCKSASAVIAMSRPLADKLSARHTAPVHVVPYGFDPDDYPPAPDTKSEYFDIVYCGLVYGERNPAPLLDALDGILEEGKIDISRIRVRFYGEPPGRLAHLAAGRACANLVEAMGRVPLHEMIRIEQQAAVLLMLPHPSAEGVVPSKIFDYLGARRPILSVPGDQSVTDAIIQETGAGVIAPTAARVAEALEQWYSEWETTGTVGFRGVPGRMAVYTRKNQAQRMAQILDKVCK